MSNQPNWNKAPKGATHYSVKNGCFIDENGVFLEDGSYVLLGELDLTKFECLPRPTINQQLTVPVVKESLTTEKVVCSKMETTTWDGQGLPSAGVECEYRHRLQDSDNPNAWQKCFIIGFTKDCQWLCFHSYAGDHVEMHAVNGGVYEFRPIKTDRERWINAALGLRKPGAYTDEQWLSDIYEAFLEKLPEQK